jgi:hypothetical protein
MRDLDPSMQAALEAGVLVPALLAQITFVSGTEYIWSGVGPLVYGGNTYSGVGSLGTIGAISEGVEVKAAGTSVTLSGIDPTLYADSMDDIVTGQPAKIWFALLANGAIIGAPFLAFSGLTDLPTVSEDGETISITINLENRLTNLQRANARRYTSADQRIKYPTDTFFAFVEALCNTANMWGS